jgi:hypothetical protein
MFFKKRKQFPSDRWVVLEIDSRVLWELDCAFCATNAWSPTMRRTPIEELKSVHTLQSLFGAETGNFPIDAQAEVLELISKPD